MNDKGGTGLIAVILAVVLVPFMLILLLMVGSRTKRTSRPRRIASAPPARDRAATVSRRSARSSSPSIPPPSHSPPGSVRGGARSTRASTSPATSVHRSTRRPTALSAMRGRPAVSASGSFSTTSATASSWPPSTGTSTPTASRSDSRSGPVSRSRRSATVASRPARTCIGRCGPGMGDHRRRSTAVLRLRARTGRADHRRPDRCTDAAGGDSHSRPVEAAPRVGRFRAEHAGRHQEVDPGPAREVR